MQKEFKADIVIIGGCLGGVAAALAAAKMGKKVILTEETKWLGGQLTSQAVPPDENQWIEKFGSTRSYRQLRDGVRSYYKTHMPLTQQARDTYYLNPGNGFVSRLCHDPRVTVAVIDQMLAPYTLSARQTVCARHKMTAASTEGDQVKAVVVENIDTG